METFYQKEGLYIPHLGLAAASFAAFLGIMTMNQSTELAVKAVENFSIGITLTLASLFLPGIKDKHPIIQGPVLWLNSIFVLFGSLFCLLGLHKCFRLVSDQAAKNFAAIAIFIFILMLTTGVYEIVRAYLLKTKKIKDDKTNS